MQQTAGSQDMAAVFAPRMGRERFLAVGEIDVRLAHQLPGKLTEEHVPRSPFGKLSWWRCSERPLAGAGQVCRKVSHMSRV